MDQNIVFKTVATVNPDQAVGHGRYVENASTGIGMDVLQQIIHDHIPTVNNEQVTTIKAIIRTDRYECPCCNTDLVALVDVYCSGLVTSEWEVVRGLYRVTISPDHGDCRVHVEKLSGTIIYLGRTPYLPRKNYVADDAARSEIEERDAAFAEMARQNPGRVLSIDGIETAEDLASLVKVVSQTMEGEK